jgi:hypothetical protein
MTDAMPRHRVSLAAAVRKQSSFWPQRRRLFHGRKRRGIAVTAVVLALSIGAAVLLVSVLRQPAF